MLEYKVATCTLHALNLTLSVPIENILGKSGLQLQTMLQLLFTAYNLTQQYRSSEWKLLWETCTGIIWHKMKKPVLSRWDSVLEGADHVLKRKGEWMSISLRIAQVEDYGSTKHTIASFLTSYLEEKMLISHLQLVSAYGSAWFLRHFNWQKHVDDKTLCPGFLSVHEPIRFFVQTRDLENLTKNWKTMGEFQDYITEFDDSNSTYTKDALFNAFLNLAQNRHDKHFQQWNDIFYFALAADSLPATHITRWLLEKTSDLN